MSSVTFSSGVGGDGSTVTDDNNATTGLREGGWKTRFVPAFTQQVAVAGFVVTKAGEAATSAANAAASAANAAASYDSFDDRYLGAKASNPTLDNDGGALLTGAIYWNTTSSEMRAYSGSAWTATYLPAGVTSFAGNSTGLTPATSTTGAITLGGTLVAANGGTGLSTVGTAGNVLTSNGTTWQSTTPAASGASKGQAIAYSLIFGS